MALKPLGHRILVQPDAQPEKTDSGLVLPGDRDHVPVSGRVVAVGDGPARDAKIRSAVILRCIGILDELEFSEGDPRTEHTVLMAAKDELRRYKNQMEHFDSMRVGDRVVYPVEAGLKLTEDGHDYILLNEDEAVVIATEEENAA